MPKLEIIVEKNLTKYLFYCPGCKYTHSFDVRTDGKRPSWTFNGNLELPTFSPSLICLGQIRCHVVLTDGKLSFCDDCQHELKGQVVELPDFKW